MSNSENNPRKTLEEIEKEMFNSNSPQNQKISSLISSVKNWFTALPSTGKVIVGIVGIMISFSLLKTVLSIVQLVFSLGILAVIFYLVYQFVVKPKN